MYCVELATSRLPAASSSEFWPAQRTASVVPSGLSRERTASPATKLGYWGNPGLRSCCTEPGSAVGVMLWPVARRIDAGFADSWEPARAGCRAAATIADVIRPKSSLVFILLPSLLMGFACLRNQNWQLKPTRPSTRVSLEPPSATAGPPTSEMRWFQSAAD